MNSKNQYVKLVIKELNFLPGTRGQKTFQEIVLRRGISLGIRIFVTRSNGQFERTVKYAWFAGFPALQVACRTAGVAGGPSALLKLRQSFLITVNLKNCLTPKNPKMCDPILVALLKMPLHYSQSSRENATPSSAPRHIPIRLL